jgi:hypothetical protein
VKVKIAFQTNFWRLDLKRASRLFYFENNISWAIDGTKLWPFENVNPNDILAVIFDLRI